MNVDEKKNGYKIRVLVQSLYMISFEKKKKKKGNLVCQYFIGGCKYGLLHFILIEFSLE